MGDERGGLAVEYAGLVAVAVAVVAVLVASAPGWAAALRGFVEQAICVVVDADGCGQPDGGTEQPETGEPRPCGWEPFAPCEGRRTLAELHPSELELLLRVFAGPHGKRHESLCGLDEGLQPDHRAACAVLRSVKGATAGDAHAHDVLRAGEELLESVQRLRYVPGIDEAYRSLALLTGERLADGEALSTGQRLGHLGNLLLSVLPADEAAQFARAARRGDAHAVRRITDDAGQHRRADGTPAKGWSRNNTSNIPDQGTIRPRRGDGPNVDAGKQGKHVPGHRNYDPGAKSAFAVDDHVELTSQAWAKGRPVEGRKRRRRWDVGREVGAGGETKITVVVDDAGTVHGWPSE